MYVLQMKQKKNLSLVCPLLPVIVSSVIADDQFETLVVVSKFDLSFLRNASAGRER
jgi:hypothetical protein